MPTCVKPILFSLDPESLRTKIPKVKPAEPSAEEKAAANKRKKRSNRDADSGNANDRRSAMKPLVDNFDHLRSALEVLDIDDHSTFDYSTRRMLPLSRDTLPILYRFFDTRTFFVASSVNRLWFRVACQSRWSSSLNDRSGRTFYSSIEQCYDASDWMTAYRSASRWACAPHHNQTPNRTIDLPTHCGGVPVVRAWTEPHVPAGRMTTAGEAARQSVLGLGGDTKDEKKSTVPVSADTEPVMHKSNLWILLAHPYNDSVEIYKIVNADGLPAASAKAQLVCRLPAGWSSTIGIADPGIRKEECRSERLFALNETTKEIVVPATNFKKSRALILYSFGETVAPSPASASAGLMDAKHSAAGTPLPSTAAATSSPTNSFKEKRRFVLPTSSVAITHLQFTDSIKAGRLLIAGLASGEVCV